MIRYLRGACTIVAVLAVCLRRDATARDMFSWSPEGWEHDRLDTALPSAANEGRSESVREEA
jgi:hypothetical protein